MEKLRIHADLCNDNRKYLGAIAGMVSRKSSKLTDNLFIFPRYLNPAVAHEGH